MLTLEKARMYRAMLAMQVFSLERLALTTACDIDRARIVIQEAVARGYVCLNDGILYYVTKKAQRELPARIDVAYAALREVLSFSGAEYLSVARELLRGLLVPSIKIDDFGSILRMAYVALQVAALDDVLDPKIIDKVEQLTVSVDTALQAFHILTLPREEGDTAAPAFETFRTIQVGIFKEALV